MPSIFVDLNTTPNMVLFRLTISIVVFLFVNGILIAQSSSATYTAGNIPLNYSVYSATCNGAATPLSVNIPAGSIVTSISVSYSILAANGAWISEQQSQLSCVQTGNTEAVFTGAGGNVSGNQVYNRAGVTIANGTSATGVLTFQLRGWRTWGGGGCESTYQVINNNSWTVTVFYAAPAGMSYVSSTTVQASNASIQSCATSAEIIRTNIVTSGTLTPLSVTQFTIGTAGTTNLGSISQIRIYSTGNSAGFSNANLFGTAVPGGTVNVNGSQTLVNGNNYFWVVYDFITPLTNGNTFDATCNALVVGGVNRTPTVTNPAGNRIVSACSPSPGGIQAGLQTWLNSNSGTVGTPVVQWNNLAANVNIPSLTAASGANLVTNDAKSNFNNTLNTTGAHNGTFHREVSNRNQVISGNEVTMYAAYQRNSAPDLVFEFHGSTVTNSTSNTLNSWYNWGFRPAAIGVNFSNGLPFGYHLPGLAQMSDNAGFAGLHGTSNSSGGNTLNGNDMSFPNIGAFTSGTNFMELSVGYWPGYGMTRGVMEVILWDRDLSVSDRRKVETYFGLKYGITLGMNGTSMNYISPTSGNIIWNSSINSGYNYDIAGISRSDVSALSQIKSHSTNGPSPNVYNDIVAVVNGTNFSTPGVLTVDDSHLIWGHNGQPTQHQGPYTVNIPTDNGEFIEAIFQRKWKSQETGSVGVVTLEFDMNLVPGIGTPGVLGTNDLANLRLLIDEDGDFATGATAISPSSYSNTTNIAYFQHNFTPTTGVNLVPFRGFFFTLGSTDATTTPLPVELIDFHVKAEDCSIQLEWSTASEQNSKEFLVEKSVDISLWTEVCRINAAGNSTNVLAYACQDEIKPGNGSVYYRLNQIDNDGTSTIYDMRSVQLNCEYFKPFLYPNPSQGTVFIESPFHGTATITDAKGKVILNAALEKGSNSLGLELISNGVYFVSILLENNSTEILRFIKD